MGYTVAEKIILNHLKSGNITGGEISISIDQTLTQDSTGTMAYLQFEAMNVPRVRTKKSVAYIDHNTLQAGPENADDHKYIQTVAKKHGIYFSKPGNGICHQVHLERFGVPGMTLLGSDSHTPTCGGIGMLAIGAGGLDVAVAMGGGAYYLTMPKIINVVLKGSLRPYVTAKDIILEVLRLRSVKGGVGSVIEYTGDIESLSVPERATITNMGAELGATTSIFPSDDITRRFLKAQWREEDWMELLPDSDAEYHETVVINLDTLEPLAACPNSPDAVKKVSELKGMKVDQVAIGSCTNSSLFDMMKVASILSEKTIHEDVSLVISPGSKQVLTMLSQNGALSDMLAAGGRVLESACGPCIGMGQAPKTDAVSLRTFNRNFFGRSGTKSAEVYLVSPETAAASALSGVFTDPRDLGEPLDVTVPGYFLVDANLVAPPAKDGENIEIVRGPNIKPFPINKPMRDKISGSLLLKMQDNITTDHIMPSNATLLPFRSNIPHLANYCLSPVDETLPKRAMENGGGFLAAGHNYGQGSSREHAALVPLYLGIKGIIAKSFARIHFANLINSGILPLTFVYEADYNLLEQGDEIAIEGPESQVRDGFVTLSIKDKGTIKTKLELTERLKDILAAGGLLNYTRGQSSN